MKFPYIQIEGDVRTRGLQYGRAAGEIIRRGLQIYKPALERAKISESEFERRAQAFATALADVDASLMTELEAVAEGAELQLSDLLLISGRTELLYGSANPDPDDGCTAAVALPKATGGPVLHGQNWDWRDECVHSTIVLHILPDEGPEIITLVEAGGLARCGLNSSGIGITGNFLRCERDNGEGGIPLALLRRKVLDCTHYANALGVVASSPTSFSNNIIVSSASGHAVNFEKIPGEAFWIRPNVDGLLVHSNHFLTEAARVRVHDLGIATSPDTLYRDTRVFGHLAGDVPNVTEASFRKALADRFEWPHSVCRPPLEGGIGGATVSSVATVIMDVTAGKFTVCAAPYENEEFQVFSLQAGGPKE